MVKAPEKFLNEYLSHEKGFSGKKGTRGPKIQIRKVSDEEFTRFKQNLQIIWGIYCTPEIKDILSRKHKIHFLNIEGANASLNLSYVDKGIFMEYEVNTGSKKELAGAQVYKQGGMSLNRYFTSITGMEELLRTTNVALQAVVDVLIEREMPETDIWNAIAKGAQIQQSMAPCI
ncbi:MAG: hypothetical protein HUU08_09965 [Candidatus Brocadia sp.]|nr:hypothetical protein [Candidatus Brocadia sp.]